MPTVLAFYICCWAYLNATGWLLSALHQLNLPGYALALLPGIFLALLWLKKNPPACWWGKVFRRFRRPLPVVFLLVAALAFIGGALYAPTNYDALTYRLPRLLNWLAADGWHWLATGNERMNYSTPAWEWTALPGLLFTHSDRGLFLINILGFLLLPSLLFSVFRQLGVAARVAWTWMWLLPLAYGYVSQAGSIGNDLTGAVFCLAAVYYGLRARRTGQVTDIWLCGLAAALLTANKLSNLPLLLPCLVAVWPALPQLRCRWLETIGITLVAVLVSAAPVMLFNQIHTGNWTGDPQNLGKMQINNPIAGGLGNAFLLAEQSLLPPVLPVPNLVNSWLEQRLPASLKENFSRLSLNKLNELPGEEGAGLGLGITLPLLLVLGVSVGCLRRPGFFKNARHLLSPVALAAGIAMLFFMAKIGSEAGPRLLLPYYPLALVPLLRLPAQNNLLRHRAWRWLLVATALGALPVLILSPTRPLWPAVNWTQKLARQHPDNATLQRAATVYSVYAHRNDVLAPVRDRLPDEARVIGFLASSNDTDYSLWWPLGRRQVVWLRDGFHSGIQLPPDLQWLVIKRNIWPEVCDQPLEAWAAAHSAKIVAEVPVTTLVSWGAETWCILQIERP